MSAGARASPPVSPARRRAARWPALAVLAVAAGVRLWTWDVVFQPAGVMLLADSDPHYHVLRAERLLRGAPGAPWRDPEMNWPLGAEVVWPPLFDAVIAAAAWFVGGSAASRELVARIAAFLPVVLGLATVALVAALGRELLGARRGWLAALLVAILPSHAVFTALGRPDQHGAELALFAAVMLLFARAVRRDERWLGDAAGLAVLVAISFWTWQGSAVLLVVPVAFALASHVLAPAVGPPAARAARALAAAGLGGGLLLAASVAALGPPGALGRPGTGGVNGLHVAIAAGAGMTGALLLAFGRAAGARGAGRRSAEAAAALVLPALALLGSSGALRSGSMGGLAALLRANAWYGNISEFRPLFTLGGSSPLLEDVAGALDMLGLLLPFAAAAVPAARRRWRRGTGRAEVLLLGLSVLGFLLATLARRRFGGYLVVVAAIAGESGIRSVAAWAARRVRFLRRPGRAVVAAGALLCVAPAIAVDLHGAAQLSQETATAIEAFTQLRGLAAPPGREAVLAPWQLGHLVQYAWERPVVVTPFGVEGGEGAFQAWAAFFFARSAEDAEAAVAARRVAFVVLDNPANAADELLPYAAPGTPTTFHVRRDLVDGKTAEDTPAFWALAAARLYFRDGRGGPGALEPLAGFRLVIESPPTAPGRPSEEQQLKVFGAVPGARVAVAGATPGRFVQATARLRTNMGRIFPWSIAAPVGPDGSAALRLPYATGWNGLVWADPWSVTDGAAQVSVVLGEADVMEGRTVEVAMARGGRR